MKRIKKITKESQITSNKSSPRFLSSNTMPISFPVADVDPRPVFKASERLDTPEALLNAHVSRIGEGKPWEDDARPKPPPVALMQSSFVDAKFSKMDLRSGRNGFVQAVTHAYNRHHHLIIRPDDVWIAILSQLSIYVNKHAESLRSQFVAHKGKAKLTVIASGSRHTVDFGGLAKQMTDKIGENIVNPSLKTWILPNFTTTTPNDTVVCSVMMMATMKTYFDYEMTMCGLPSVTLEGEKSDWEKLYQRVDTLETFGDEPKAWAKLLRPVLRRFAEAFNGEPDIDFWNKVSHHYSLGSGTQYLSGWITAFCVWDSEGKWQATPRSATPVISFGEKKYHPKLMLDKVHYPSIDSADVPMGFCEVDVKVVDDEGVLDCVMIAGHMANLVEGRYKDTLRPIPSWFMYVKPITLATMPEKPDEPVLVEEDDDDDTDSLEEKEEVGGKVATAKSPFSIIFHPILYFLGLSTKPLHPTWT
ncbi:hypothetical protein GALMADRAFT_237259 [Galerina marginata CBS 339.88]|uniref:Uncharacterized protein n=1 Tax=Galerina marginata (strain CBS 339.88) TaxID=685588 RepID=A0A067TQ15_GALM3|nr:hypothetical protein GALMADRAFT_237259 [Galerina marginata CBS 339.88]